MTASGMWARARTIALAVVVTLAAASCADDAPQDFLTGVAGDNAQKADRLWDITFIVAAVIFFIVEGLLIFALVRFRQRPGREAAQFHGNTKVEILLTAVPALILAAIGVPTVATIFDLAEEPPAAALDVEVVAHQFWWEYRYDLNEDGTYDDLVTANELHLPVDKDVRLKLSGDIQNKDVIHSFWVPRLGGAQDVIPGRTNYLNLRAEETGEYYGQCKEFCGLSHANMRLRVIVDDEAGFEQWVADQQLPAEPPASGLAAQGADLFANGQCVGCHTIDGTEASGLLGPNLTHLASRSTFAGAIFETNEENLANWLADPPAVKPGSRMPDLGLSQTDIDALVAYLLTLK